MIRPDYMLRHETGRPVRDRPAVINLSEDLFQIVVKIVRDFVH